MIVLTLAVRRGVLFAPLPRGAACIFAIILVVKRNRFIAQSRSRQRWIVLILGFIHFVAFVLFFG